MHLNESGQSQILAALFLTSAMLTGTLFALERATTLRIDTIKGGRALEMRAALDGAIQHASLIFRGDAACDPRILDRKLGLLDPEKLDGTLVEDESDLSNAGKAGTRQMNVKTNGRTYRVSFGAVTRVEWRSSVDPGVLNKDPTMSGSPPSYNSGVSQDAQVEVWTTDGFSRVSQKAVLINNCSYPCADQVTGASNCNAPKNPSMAFHALPDAAVYPNDGELEPPYESETWYGRIRCASGGFFGDLRGPASNPTQPDGEIGVDDLHALKEFLRNGTSEFVPVSSIVGDGHQFYGCGDLNLDWQVNELDLGILEKQLRGYLFWVPVGADFR